MNNGQGAPAGIVGLGIGIWILFVAIHLGLCFAVGKFGENKGRSFWLGFLLSFFISALVGFIVILAMGDNRTAVER